MQKAFPKNSFPNVRDYAHNVGPTWGDLEWVWKAAQENA